MLLLVSCAGPTEIEHPPPEVRATEVRHLARRVAPIPQRLPPAARQTREGYWLGAMIDASDVEALSSMGVRVVISAVQPSEKTHLALERFGMEHVLAPMSDSFRHAERILHAVDGHAPTEVFIHCRHGADRTGAIAAFLLVVRHGWSVADALYSVLYPSEADVRGLVELLGGFGIDDPRAPDDPTVGFYSVSAAGGVGGLKARNARYGRLVRTTIEAMLARAI